MTKLTVLGDIMCDYEMSKRLSTYNLIDNPKAYEEMFTKLRTFLSSSDFVIANLETPISFENKNYTSKQWEFNTSYHFAEALKKSGIGFVTTANNHCLDRGIDGLLSTVNSLQKANIGQCGINIGKGKRYRVVNINGIKVGVLAYTYGTNAFSNGNYLPFKNRKTVNLLQEQEGLIKKLWLRLFRGHLIRIYNKFDALLFPDNKDKQVYEKNTLSFYRKYLILTDIRQVKKEKPDHIISCLHIGGQYNRKPSNYTTNISEWFVKHGCNIVICNHEHVIHGFKINDSGFIAYALGNCLGSAGLCKKPFDRRSDYSIAVHFYFDYKTRELDKITFSVLKTVLLNDSVFQVWPVQDFLEQCPANEKESIRFDAIKAANDFANCGFTEFQSEFEIENEGIYGMD